MSIRELSETDTKSVVETGPAIANVQLTELESQADLKEWLSENAPAFARRWLQHPHQESHPIRAR